MNEYHYYTVAGQEVRLKKCEKPDCFRLTSALYCCPSCDYADQKKFELEDDKEPPLGHWPTCNERHAERRHLKTRFYGKVEVMKGNYILDSLTEK